MVRTYAHTDVGALDRIKASFALNDQMREAARKEIANGSTCPAQRATAEMTDAEFSAWDERIVRANLKNMREAGMSDAQIEYEFSNNFTPAVAVAYERFRRNSDAGGQDAAL